MSSAPALVIGLALYGRGEHLEEALEALLGQTRGDIAIVVTDDAADPAARDVLDRFHDDRLVYRRNPERLGLVGNWRRAFEVARRMYPEAPYFAWGSDHDAWHPYWAERILATLEREPGGVLAYPRTFRMDERGSTLPSKNWTFTTAGPRVPPRACAPRCGTCQPATWSTASIAPMFWSEPGCSATRCCRTASS